MQGFRVEPMSIKHAWEGAELVPGRTVLSTCNAMTPATQGIDPNAWQSVDKADTIVFTYDVKVFYLRFIHDPCVYFMFCLFFLVGKQQRGMVKSMGHISLVRWQYFFGSCSLVLYYQLDDDRALPLSHDRTRPPARPSQRYRTIQ
jgi:hypothetical protein